MRGNDVDWLVDKLVRVASEREGLAGELNSARAMLADLERDLDGLVAFVAEYFNINKGMN